MKEKLLTALTTEWLTTAELATKVAGSASTVRKVLSAVRKTGSFEEGCNLGVNTDVGIRWQKQGGGWAYSLCRHLTVTHRRDRETEEEPVAPVTVESEDDTRRHASIVAQATGRWIGTHELGHDTGIPRRELRPMLDRMVEAGELQRRSTGNAYLYRAAS